MLSSLAEVPDRVKSIFLTKESNRSGIYLVLFYINDE